MGRKRLYPSEAEKQRAYRIRHGQPSIKPRHPLSGAERGRRWRQRKQLKDKVYHRSLTVEWETPHALFATLHAEFCFTLDVCATAKNTKCPRFFSQEDDGLSQDWEGVCWMNPPYGPTIGSWMRKAHESAQYGAVVVCLVPSRTDTKWWHRYAQHGDVRFLSGRLTFGNAANPAPFPNAIVIFRPTIALSPASPESFS